VPGVVVLTHPNGTGRADSAITDAAGHYRMQNVAGCLAVTLSRQGYESSQPGPCIELLDDTVYSATIQRVLRIEAGGELDNTVWTADPVWVINGDEGRGCDGSCKFVRIFVPTDGTLIAHLSSTLSKAQLGLSMSDNYGSFIQHVVGSGEIAASLYVSASREVHVWIEGGSGSDLPFHLNTQLLAPGQLVESSPRAGRVFGCLEQTRAIRPFRRPDDYCADPTTYCPGLHRCPLQVWLHVRAFRI